LKELEQETREQIYNQINEVSPEEKKKLSIYLHEHGRNIAKGKKVETDFIQFVENVIKPAKDVIEPLNNEIGTSEGKG
jgi:endonuclease III